MVNQILAQVKGRDVERLVNEVMLRLAGAGRIFPENYVTSASICAANAHFTSPIRRYATSSCIAR